MDVFEYNIYYDLKILEDKIDQINDYISLLKRARNKRDRIKKDKIGLYTILGKRQQENDLRRAELVAQRIENRLKNITKELTI